MDIAICGAACRLPGGASSPERLWKLLVDRVDAVTEIPSERWNKDALWYPHRPGSIEPGTSYVWSAGVVEDIEDFDPAFFGISPREAAQMDPQQRLMLELAWEALEDAGVPAASIAGSPTGVYVGVSLNDYSGIRLGDGRSIDSAYMTGTALSIVSNRVSYALDLHGPSLSVDTACSSSLVALHLACQALRTGEIPRALVGGVNALLTPFAFVGFSSASMLSPLGRCRTFDKDALGYVRAEGGVAFLLEPLAEALARGRRILGLIRATGVNSDGRKNGIALPNPDAQEALLRRLYLDAGIDPAAVRYIEAHGTGTAVGDPLELRAIGGFFGPYRRPGDPLLAGSIKSNIGHLESGAGLAGTLKALLALGHRAVPPGLHFETPNPLIPFDQLGIKVVTDLTPLPPAGPVLVGVNSFGFGGTNAHVVLSSFDAPAGPKATPPAPAPTAMPPLRLSARSAKALSAQAASFAERLGDASPDEGYAIARAVRFHRDLHPQRLVAAGGVPAEVAGRLRAFAGGKPTEGIWSGTALPPGSRVAFMYSGNGSQWPGMGVELLAGSSAFGDAVARVDRVFSGLAGWSIRAELEAGTQSSRLAATEVAQPCLFAIQVGLSAVLDSWGVVPSFVFGHSVGEVAAAYAAGALTLEQASTIIHRRSLAQAKTRGLGRMAAVGLAPEQAREAIARFGGAVELACINAPRSVTLAGPLPHLEGLRAELEPAGVFFRILDLDYAFHSRVLDPVRDELLAALPEAPARAGRIPFVSAITGDELPGESLDRRYWWDNLRSPVQFAAALDRLVERGVRLFVEVGPHPILAGYVREVSRARSIRLETVGLMDRRGNGKNVLAQAEAQLFLLADAVDTTRDFPRPAARVPLPTYPWQKERFTYEPSPDAAGTLKRPHEHPLLGIRPRPQDTTWESRIDPRLQPWLADHVVGDHPVFPGSAFVEMALAAGSLHPWNGARDPQAVQCVEDLQIVAPMDFQADEPRLVRLAATQDDGRFTIESRPSTGGTEWVVHALGKLIGGAADGSPRIEVPDDTEGVWIPGARHYADAAELGLRFGPAFRGVRSVRVDGTTAWGRIEAPEVLDGDPARYLCHPALLDACFQVLLELAAAHLPRHRRAYVPVHFGKVLRRAAGVPAFVRVELRKIGTRSLLVDYLAVDAEGLVLVEITGCRLQGTEVVGPESGPVPLLEMDLEPRQRYRAPEASSVAGIAVAASLAAGLRSEADRTGRADYHASAGPLVDAAAAAALHGILATAPGASDPHTLDEWVAATGADPGRIPLVRSLLRLLVQLGVLAKDGERFRLLPDPGLAAPRDVWRALVAAFPAYGSQWLALGRVLLHLASFLTGARSPEDLLPSDQADGLLDQLTEHSPPAGLHRTALLVAVERLASALPAGRGLRILELRPRSAARATAVMSRLGGRPVEYDLGSDDARVRADLGLAVAALPRTRVLALGDGHTRAPDLEPYDLVVVPDDPVGGTPVAETITEARSYLLPGGLLLLSAQGPSRWQDLVFGLNPSWWRGSGDEAAGARAPAGSWAAAMSKLGLEDVAVAEEPGAPPAGAFVVSAREPAASAAGTRTRAARGTWIVTSDRTGAPRGLVGEVVASLSAAGARVVRVVAGPGEAPATQDELVLSPTRPEDLAALRGKLRTELPVQGVVHLMGLGDGVDPAPDELLELQTRRLATVAALVKEIPPAPPEAGRQRWVLVSRSAFRDPTDPDTPLAPSQRCLVGFARVMANEYRDRRVQLVDLAGREPLRLLPGLLDEILDPDDEDEVVLAPSGRYVARLTPRPEPGTVLPAEGDQGTTLVATGRGLAQLRWMPAARPSPGAGEVEIETRAVGLNFRDVMWAMGLLPEEALEDGFAGPSLGLECSGVVSRVGEGVQGLAPGDPVIAYGPACLSRYMVTRAHAVGPKPPSISFEEAATICGAFFTAYYCLEHLAKIAPGERVLVHGGAGGVGLAAIQYASLKGCEVFATAGGEEKRDFLRLLGVPHVLGSRSLAFAQDIAELTRGEGVDVVINSLAGEAIPRSLSVLRPFGRFLELGKRDFYANSRIGLRPLRRNIAYFGVDADQLFAAQPTLASRLFKEMLALFADGSLRPLVHRVFPRPQAVDAFRHLQQSRHLGKVVLSTVDPGPLGAPPAGRPEAVRGAGTLPPRPDATYLVVGGTGGFGLETARWLAARGARSLALLSRRGPATPGIDAAVRELAAQGTRVLVLEGDAADRASLARALARIAAEAPPLRGVVHAAMVLEDSTIQGLAPDQLRKVLAPKVLGARNLDDLTRGLELDFFVLYSSATTLFGNPGQAAYVAANCYLEALAEERRRRGEPALAIGWGAITDAGVLTRQTEVREHLERRVGDAGLTAAEALETLGKVHATAAVAVGATRLDWARIEALLGLARLPKYREAIRRMAGPGSSKDSGPSFRERIRGLAQEERLEAVLDLVRRRVGEVLQWPTDRIDVDAPTMDLGLDSLMGVELRTALERDLETSLPIGMLAQGGSLRALARLVSARLDAGPGTGDRGDQAEQLSDLAARHGTRLDDQQIMDVLTKSEAARETAAAARP